MPGTLIEAFCASDDKPAPAGDLIFKEVLREGDFRFTPTDAGLVNKPFRVVREGASSKKDGVISMADIVRSFEGKAYDHVQVPLAEKKGADHEDYARVNTGFVEKLEVRDGDDGRARLVAGIRFTEPEVAEKVKRGTIANCSSGLWFDRVRPSDGANFPVAMRHVALTNTPFVDNLKPFGVALSEADGEDPDEVITIQAADEAVWTPNESFSRLQQNVGAAFDELNQVQNPLGLDQANAKVLFPRDIWTTKALAEDMSSGEVWVVPYKRKKDSVELAPNSEWVRAEQQWIAASEASPVRVYGRHVAEESVRKAREAREAAKDNKTEPSDVQASEPAKPAHDLSTPQGRLRAAQEARRGRLHTHNPTRGGATSMSGRVSVDLSKLELSDEDRSAIQATLDENERLRRERRETEVETEVKRVMDLGLSENTGFVKLYRRLLLADDGEPAAVLMSEDGSGRQEEVTLTKALKTMIDALPRNKEGKITLSDQALVHEAGKKPPAEADEEREESVDDAIADTRKRLGLDA